MQLDQAIEILSSTPGTLRSLLSRLSDPWLTQNEGPETWSPYDVVGHLIHGEKTDWISRIKIILQNGQNKTFTPFDRFAFFSESKGKSLAQLLDTFETLRKENLVTLNNLELKPLQFVLKGTHPEFGTVTLGQLISTWVVHDLGHIYQAVRTMAGQYKDHVGPWQAYLPVLNPR